MEERETMKKNLLAYSIILLSLCCFVNLSLGWSSFIFIALAVLLFFQQRGEGMSLPPVSLLLLANVLGYPIIVVMPWLYRDLWTRMNPYIIEIAMLWALRGFAAFCCAYLLGDAFARYLHRRQVHHGWDDGERVAYIRYAVHAMGILSIIAWAIKSYHFGFGLTFIDSRTMLDVNSSGSSVSMMLDQLLNLREPFLFFFGIMHRQLRSRFMWLLFAGIAVGLLFEIVTIGSKGAIIRLSIIAALVIAFTTRRLNFKQFCAGALIAFTVYMAFAIITEYRGILLDKHARGQDVFDISVQVDAFTEAFMTSLPFTEKVERRRTTVSEEDIFGRISSGIYSFSYLLYYTGGRSPHEHAWEVFLLPVYSVVPRSLVEKPIFFNSVRFGREYFHGSTAISVSTVGSFYYAWGYGGILAGMALLGALVAFFVQRAFLLRETALNSGVLMVAMIMMLVNVGTMLWEVGIALCRLALIMLGLYMLYPMVKKLKNGRAPMAPSATARVGDYEPF